MDKKPYMVHLYTAFSIELTHERSVWKDCVERIWLFRWQRCNI